MKINYQVFLNFLEIVCLKKVKVIYVFLVGVYGNIKVFNVVGKNESFENVYGFFKFCMDEFVFFYLNDNI